MTSTIKRYWPSIVASFVVLLFCIVFQGRAAHAAPVPGANIPVTAMPATIRDYLLDCGGTNNAAAQIGWVSLAGQPTVTVTTVSYNTPSITLQYNVAGIVCRASDMGGLYGTNNGIIGTAPTNLGLVGKTVAYRYGPSTGNYSVATLRFTYTQPGNFIKDTTVDIDITEKRINLYSVPDLYRCVTNPSDVGNNFRVPRNSTDYGACKSEGFARFDVKVNVTPPSPSVSCTITDSRIEVDTPFLPSADFVHNGPAPAPDVNVSGTITVQGQNPNTVRGSIKNGGKLTLTAPSRQFATPGRYTITGVFSGTSTRPPIPIRCSGVLTVVLPPPVISCAVSDITILAGESVTPVVTVKHNGPARAPGVNYSARVDIDTKPSQTRTGSLTNGQTSQPLALSANTYGTGIFNITVTVTGSNFATPPPCRAKISSFNRPYVRTYNNDVLSGYGFFTGTTCSTGKGDITTYGRGDPFNYSGSGAQMGVFAKGEIKGFRSASTLGSAVKLPELLAFANTTLVSRAAGTYGGNFGSGTCMYDYWSASSKATVLNTQTLNVGLLTSGSYYVKSASPVTIIGTVPNGVRLVLYIEGTALLRGATMGYAATTWPNKAAVPSLYVIAKGNIAVAGEVRNLDGHFIAQKSTAATSGRITSCVDPSTAQPYASALAQLANCSAKLVVNGSFNAEHVNLLRIFNTLQQAQPGEAAGVSNAAEVFIYPLESWFSTQNVDTIRQQTYDSITALPPSL